MTATPPPPIDVLARYPRMTGWFQPTLLARLLRRLIVSETFGHYADRRLLVAALDTVDEAEHERRATMLAVGDGPGRIRPDEDGAIWIDYVADLGDGFDATYAIASLLARERLTVDGVETRRGQALFMGGDEVYPDASAENYQMRLIDPYGWAFPDPDPDNPDGPSLYAIPGNHDWYDGLVSFLAIFTRGGGSHVGGWRTRQRRSYFAVQVAPTWWVWGVDAQLADRVDQPQADYFALIARKMPAGSNLILLSPEPGWIFAERHAERPLGVIDDVAAIAIKGCAGAQIRLVLSGDLHHYSRYTAERGGAQFVTSGGGGAYLHPTHDLPERVAFIAEGRPSWLDAGVKGLSLGRDGDGGRPDAPVREGAPALFPGREESKRLLNRALLFPWLNPGFAGLFGLLYAGMGAVAALLWPDSLYLVPLGFFALFHAYARRRESSTAFVAAVAAINAIAHAAAVFALVVMLRSALHHLPDALSGPRASFLIVSIGMVALGGAVGASLVGFAFFALSRWANADSVDAFSGIRLDSHRHFLRIRIRGEEATLFPIALRRTPRRRDWRANAARAGAPAPAYVAEPPLEAQLIERPVPILPRRIADAPLDAAQRSAYADAHSHVVAERT